MDGYIKAMFGCYAMHVPVNLIVQDANDGIVTICGTAGQRGTPNPLLFGSKATHQLIMGDMVVRPHAIIESDAFRGHGISALLTMGQSAWIEDEHKVLLDKMGDIEQRIYGEMRHTGRLTTTPCRPSRRR